MLHGWETEGNNRFYTAIVHLLSRMLPRIEWSRVGKERKGKERKGKERKGKERKHYTCMWLITMTVIGTLNR